MKITIGGGTYTTEQRAIGREIVRHLRSIGLVVEETTTIPDDAAHNIVLASMRADTGDGFPLQVEVCDDAHDARNFHTSKPFRKET